VDREIVISVSVRAIGYDKEMCTLEIEFCDSSIINFLKFLKRFILGFWHPWA